MDEFKLSCVQALTGKPFVGRGGPVYAVAKQGMTDVRHMDADLMCASGLETAADVRVAAIARNDLPVRHGIA